LAAELADGETEVSILLPRRSYGRAWRRILHDQTADRIVDIVSQLSHVNATIVPFLVEPGIEDRRLLTPPPLRKKKAAPADAPHAVATAVRAGPGVTPIAELHWRDLARVAGRVKTVRVQPWADVPTLECVLVDGSGEAITLVFLGRRSIPGIRNGTQLVADARVGKHEGKLAMINPRYELLAVPDASDTR
jgi:hypothetical protein